MMRVLKKTVNRILNLVGSLFIGGFLVLVILSFIGIKPSVVLSGSMEPEIQTGSLAFVNHKANYEDVKEGDVIAFQIPTGAMVSHRAISITEKGIETKGDSNENSDGISTTKENFKGKVLISIPYLGYGFSFAKTARGMILCGTGLLFFILLEIATSEEEMKESFEKEDADER